MTLNLIDRLLVVAAQLLKLAQEHARLKDEDVSIHLGYTVHSAWNKIKHGNMSLSHAAFDMSLEMLGLKVEDIIDVAKNLFQKAICRRASVLACSFLPAECTSEDACATAFGTASKGVRDIKDHFGLQKRRYALSLLRFHWRQKSKTFVADLHAGYPNWRDNDGVSDYLAALKKYNGASGSNGARAYTPSEPMAIGHLANSPEMLREFEKQFWACGEDVRCISKITRTAFEMPGSVNIVSKNQLAMFCRRCNHDDRESFRKRLTDKVNGGSLILWKDENQLAATEDKEQTCVVMGNELAIWRDNDSHVFWSTNVTELNRVKDKLEKIKRGAINVMRKKYPGILSEKELSLKFINDFLFEAIGP